MLVLSVSPFCFSLFLYRWRESKMNAKMMREESLCKGTPSVSSQVGSDSV